jgi:hypothetical protein
VVSPAGLGGSTPGADLLLLGGVEDGVLFLQGAELRAGRALHLPLPLGGLVEDQRGVGLELVEDEEQCAEHHDEELHRDLEEGVEHQAEPALAQGGAADVALHLRLVGAEIGERKEEAAEAGRSRRCSAAAGRGVKSTACSLPMRAGDVRGVGGQSSAAG